MFIERFNISQSPAQLGGLNIGERITQVNGARVQNIAEFRQMVDILTRNDTVKIGVVRPLSQRISPTNLPRRTSAPPKVSALTPSAGNISTIYTPAYHPKASRPPPPPSPRSSGASTEDLLGIEVAHNDNSGSSGSNSNTSISNPHASAIEKALDRMCKMSSIEFLSLTGCTRDKFFRMHRDEKIEFLRGFGVIGENIHDERGTRRRFFAYTHTPYSYQQYQRTLK